VYQRGQGSRDVFRSDADRSTYLEMLQQQAQRFGASILGYCLMNDHVHLAVLPRTKQSLAQAIGRTHWLYSQFAARRLGPKESLWQNRFFSCALDESHLADVLLYIERGPIRTRLSRYPWAYRWSSAPAHSNGSDPSGLLDMAAWRKFSTPSQWRTLLVHPEDEASAARIRLSLSTGRPLATEATLTRLERRMGRRLRALPVGRPRKKPASKPRRGGKEGA
jgi:putative transposase